MKTNNENEKKITLTEREIGQVTGGRHDVRTPLTDSLTPPGGTTYDGGETTAPDPYVQFGDDFTK